MPSQVVGPDMDADQIPCPFNDQPGGRICEREDSGIRPDLFSPDLPSEPVGNLLWQEHGFGLSAAFGISDDGFAVFDIHGFQFQDLPDTHTTAGH